MKEIKKLLKFVDDGSKITLIIGSGVNRHAYNNQKNILNDWNSLLNYLFDSNRRGLNSNFILEFERRIVAKTALQNVKSAKKTEVDILKKLCQKIKEEQTLAVKKMKYPTFLFNSDLVENVISLNYDLIPEILLSNGKPLQLLNLKSDSKNNRPNNSNRCRDVNGIKYWHPHGSVLKPDSILLGLRKYSKNAKEVEQLRKRYKSKTNLSKKHSTDNLNWFDALIQRPIIICGASLSDSEWDIWLAIVNRFRNYARYYEKEQPIFIMTDGKILNRNCVNNFIKKFSPISFNTCSYDEEWQLLEKLLGNYEHKNLK